MSEPKSKMNRKPPKAGMDRETAEKLVSLSFDSNALMMAFLIKLLERRGVLSSGDVLEALDAAVDRVSAMGGSPPLQFGAFVALRHVLTAPEYRPVLAALLKQN